MNKKLTLSERIKQLEEIINLISEAHKNVTRGDYKYLITISS